MVGRKKKEKISSCMDVSGDKVTKISGDREIPSQI